jgi:hypothetical protein
MFRQGRTIKIREDKGREKEEGLSALLLLSKF